MMATPKYKKHYEEMLSYHKDTFDLLKNYERGSEEFLEAQKKSMRLAREYENSLCSRSESTRHGQFSANLADKFWEEIRRDYPEIDFS